MSAPVNNNNNNNNHPLPPTSASSPAFSSAEAIDNARQTNLPSVSSVAAPPLPAVGREPPSSEAANQIQTTAAQVLDPQKWLRFLTSLGDETEAKEGDDENTLQDKQSKIIDALATIEENVQFPISLEEQRALGKLMDNMLAGPPEDIEEAMEGIEFLFKTHRAKHLKTLEQSLATLLSNVASSQDHLCCLSPDTAAYRIIRKAAEEEELSLGRKVAFVLHDTLVKVCQELYPDQGGQIATVIYLAGLYFVCPVQLEKNEIDQSFQRLADQLTPGQNHQSMSFNDKICLLFKHFERTQVGFMDISSFFSGLGMLALRGQFRGFSQPHSQETIDHLLDRFDISFKKSEEFDENAYFELFSGLSSLAERNLLPRFTTQTHRWLDKIVREVPKEESTSIIRKIISSLGKLSRHGCMTKLLQKGTNHLIRLIQAELTFTLNGEKIPDHYSDFLYDLGSLVQANVVPPEAIAVHETLYQKLLDKLMDRSKAAFIDDVKVHFFYNLLQEITSRNPTKWAYQSAAFQRIKEEETARHAAHMVTLQKTILLFNRGRQLQGLAVTTQRKRPGSAITRTETQDKKSK